MRVVYNDNKGLKILTPAIDVGVKSGQIRYSTSKCNSTQINISENK